MARKSKARAKLYASVLADSKADSCGWHFTVRRSEFVRHCQGKAKPSYVGHMPSNIRPQSWG